MALNTRHFLIILMLAMISTACAAEGKGLLSLFLKEAGKVTQAQVDVDKFAMRDAAVLIEKVANVCL